MKKIIFNSSMPRSGSELLQVILHQNPSIYGSPTSPVSDYIEQIRKCQLEPNVQSQPAELMKNALFGACKGLIHGYYKSITDRMIICDKSRTWLWHYDLLKNSIEEKPKMICMVRDLRDIFASMEMNWRKNRHLPIGPDNPIETKQMMLEDRVAFWSHGHPVGFALKRLHDAGTQGYLGDVFILRYEDLTMYPDECMVKMYEYLELPYFQHDWKNLIKEVEEDHKWHGPYGNHDVKKELKPFKQTHIGVLDKDTCSKIISGHQWYFSAYYPEVLEQGES